MLELDGFEARANVVHEGQLVPLLVAGDKRSVAVGSYHGPLDELAPEFSHPLQALDGKQGTAVKLVNSYRVTRNLPAAYQQIRELL